MLRYLSKSTRILLITATLALTTDRGGIDAAPKSPTPATSPRPASSTPTFSTRSIHQLDEVWSNDQGESVRLSQFEGRPLVVALFFTSCHITCPITLENLKDLEARIPDSEKEKIRFVLVTIDPTHDTPAVLKAFRKQHNLSDSRWILLQGTDQSVSRLARSLQIPFPANSKRLNHSSYLTLVDRDGRATAQHTHLRGDLKAFSGQLLECLQQSVMHPDGNKAD